MNKSKILSILSVVLVIAAILGGVFVYLKARLKKA